MAGLANLVKGRSVDSSERTAIADRVREAVNQRLEDDSLGVVASEIEDYTKEALRNLVQADPGSYTPRADKARKLARWLSGEEPEVANIKPPTVEERERLANLLERIAGFVRDGSLPEKAWAADTKLAGKRRATPEGGEAGADPDDKEASGGNGRPPDD